MDGVYFRGQDNNIFTQIGFIVLVGLACKNAILIVEFARQEMLSGKGRIEAAAEASRLRLRPILMTSFAFILGVLPLVIAKGAGAEMDQALGTAVFAGMIGVTFFGIFPTPGIFLCDHEHFLAGHQRRKGKAQSSIEYGEKMSYRSAGVRWTGRGGACSSSRPQDVLTRPPSAD